jgi:hypothetical protein
MSYFRQLPDVAYLGPAQHTLPPRLHQLKALPLALVTAAGLSLGLACTAAQAATIVVSTSSDTTTPGECTLRDAVTAMAVGVLSPTNNCANTSADVFGSNNTITFANTVTWVDLTDPLSLSINALNPLLIRGSGQGGVTIQRSSPSVVLMALQGGSLTLDGLTLTGGLGRGGAVAVPPSSTLNIKNSVLTGNIAPGNLGGAIYAQSTSSSVATVNITDSTLSNNSATFFDSLGGRGGAIYLAGASVLNISGSTLSTNGDAATTAYGGAIYASVGATVTISNSTLSNNVSNCSGAAIYHRSSLGNAAALVTLTSSTLAGNTTTRSAFCPGGTVLQYGGNLTLNNTLMSGNTHDGYLLDISSLNASTVLGANNLVRNVASTVTFTPGNEPLNVNPQLGLLQNNGGPTFTHALLTGSPAIDAGGSTALTTDQRGAGYLRVLGPAADIGAFEATIDGVCGSASSGSPALFKPTSNLCSTGDATAVSGPQPFTWGCNGIGTGSTSTAANACSVMQQTWAVTPSVATIPASGTISPASVQTVYNNATTSFTLTPMSGYAAGTATGCNGSLSGSTYTTDVVSGDCNVVASFVLTPVAGVCGTANGMPAIAAPSSNLCSTGTLTGFMGGAVGPWSWSCAPIGNSVTTASCTAPIKQFTASASVGVGGGGTVSPATRTVNYNTVTSFTLSPNPGYAIGPVTGNCGGAVSGSSFNTAALVANCAITANFTLVPINGTCGTASGVPAIAAPSANLCSTGTLTTVTGGSAGPWAWSCAPNATGTNTANCAAPIQQVTATATINGGNGAVNVPSRTINYNTVTSFTFTPSSGYLIGSVSGCPGTLSGNVFNTSALVANCAVTANFTLGPVNGVCGSASSSVPALAAPSSNLCSTGTATLVNGSGPWTWGCNGNATGSSTVVNACAVAIKTWAVTPSVSGGNGSIGPNTVVTVNNNATTSFTVTPSSGYNINSVIGCGGALSGTTFSTAAVLADCAVVATFSAVPRAVIVLSGNAVSIPNGDVSPTFADGTDFGSLTLGQNRVNTFVIANNGSTTLTINGLSFAGPHAADFVVTNPTVFPVVINAGRNTSISVRFTPSAAGPRRASLVIAYDDGAVSGAVDSVRAKALGSTGFAVQGVGVQAVVEALPVPAVGIGGLLAGLLGLLGAGLAAVRRNGRKRE